MPDIGVPELIIILIVLVLLFGARKLPELARSIGRSTSEFKRGMKEGSSEEEEPAPSAEPPPSDRPPAQAPQPVQPVAPPATPPEEEPPPPAPER
jgi:sec-independent protein translocase protein TatA